MLLSLICAFLTGCHHVGLTQIWPGHPRNTSSREKKKKTKEIHVRKQKTHGLFTNPFVPNIPMANLAATWFANNRTNFAQKNVQSFLVTDNKFPHLLCNTMCRKKIFAIQILQYSSFIGDVHLQLQSAVSESNYRSSLHFRFIELSSQQCK